MTCDAGIWERTASKWEAEMFPCFIRVALQIEYQCHANNRASRIRGGVSEPQLGKGGHQDQVCACSCVEMLFQCITRI